MKNDDPVIPGDRETRGDLVVVQDMVKSYTSGTETLYILKGVSFTVGRGTTVAINGQSGSGKSTLLNILGGLDRCDSGSAWVAGSEITRLPESGLTLYRSRRVGFIFQFHYLLKDFTALENVMIPGFIAGMKKKRALEKAMALLEDVKLENRFHHYPSQLSGGERQRVAVARSMINDPDLILADEPTGNLDPLNNASVTELLYSGAEKWGKTLIVVTHDETVARRAMVRYTLEEGRLTQTGSPAALPEGPAEPPAALPEGPAEPPAAPPEEPAEPPAALPEGPAETPAAPPEEPAGPPAALPEEPAGPPAALPEGSAEPPAALLEGSAEPLAAPPEEEPPEGPGDKAPEEEPR